MKQLPKIRGIFDKFFKFYIIIGIDIYKYMCYNFNKYARWGKLRLAEGKL